MSKAIIFMFSLVVVIVSLYWLFAISIPNIQRANEEVRLATEQAEQSQAELKEAIADVDQSINDLSN